MDETNDKIVTFLIGSRHFGVRASKVREFTAWSRPMPIEIAPDYVQGILDYMGERLPVIDLSARLGWDITQAGNRHMIMIVDSDRGPQGFVVDWIHNLLNLAEDILPAAAEATLIPPDLLEGVASIGARRIEIIALERLAYVGAKAELLEA